MSAEPAENLPVDLARNPVFRKRWKKAVDLKVSHQGNLLPTIRRRDRKRRSWPRADGCSYQGSLRTSAGLVQEKPHALRRRRLRGALWADAGEGECAAGDHKAGTQEPGSRSLLPCLSSILYRQSLTLYKLAKEKFKGPDTFSQSRGKKKKRINLELRGNKLTTSTTASTIL